MSGPSRDGVRRLRGAYSIDLAKIRPDPKQPRREYSPEELTNLTASVAELGSKQPVRVWHIEAEDVYQIISGERRYRAARAAGLSQVPCIIEDPPTGSVTPPRREILVDQIVENWQREDLNPYDLSDALRELRDEHGLSQEEIARLTSKPKSEISRFMAMQRVDPAVQQQIRADASGQFSRRHVVAISQLPTDEQGEMAERVRTGQLSAAETEREVKRRRKGTSGQAVRGAPVTVRRYAVGSVRVQLTFRKGNVSMQDVLDVLDRVRTIVEQQRKAE